MAGGKRTTANKSVPQTKRSRKKQMRRHGPVMRFKFGKLVLLWILSAILCFGMYLYDRNYHPEKDVFVREAATADTAEADSAPDEESSVEDLAPIENTQSGEAPTDYPNEEADEPAVPAAPQKANPVPESLIPRGEDYLKTCAFLGETNVYNMGIAGLLQPYNYYASDTLTLENYTTEYVNMNGTTIRILSAINSASCPIYLMFGTESLAEQPADQTADQFSILLNSVIAAAPESEVFVLAIPPVAPVAETGETPILNSVIDDYNSRLLELCNEANVYYVDTNTALKDNNGKLDPGYAQEDGIHLTTQAGQMLLDYVLHHVPS